MISVIRNLVMNSAEAFGESSGKIRITVLKRMTGDYLIIEAYDNGRGNVGGMPAVYVFRWIFYKV